MRDRAWPLSPEQREAARRGGSGKVDGCIDPRARRRKGPAPAPAASDKPSCCDGEQTIPSIEREDENEKKTKNRDAVEEGRKEGSRMSTTLPNPFICNNR